MTDVTGSDNRRSRLALAILLAAAVFLGSRGLTDESAVLLTADMSRYAMDGVFIRDLIADGGVSSYGELEDYAERYFAKYPALSVGHHPPLPYLALVPFYAVFGISIFAARLAAVGWFVLAIWAFYAFTKRFFDWRVAWFATALLVTNVLMVRFGQYVLSEMPMLALVLVSLNALLLYCDTGRKKFLAWFVVATVASLFAKQLAIFLLPVYAAVFVTRRGWQSLRSRRVLIGIFAGFIMAGAIVMITLALSPSTVWVVKNSVSGLFAGARKASIGTILSMIFGTHLPVPTLIVVIAGAVGLILKRDRRVIVPMIWLASVIGATVIIAGPTEPARYSFGAMPAYFLLAASLAAGGWSRPQQWAVPVLTAALLWQMWLIRDVRPSGAGGYETAARYVLENSTEPAVLFDGSIDTGFFVFFVRKHDPDRQRVVLRADQILMIRGERAHVRQPPTAGAIYAALRTFGIRFIVVEERKRDDPARHWLNSELKTDRFLERQRIPVVTRETKAADVDLVIYEFKDAQPADPDAEVNIDIPKGKRVFKLRFRDLTRPTGR